MRIIAVILLFLIGLLTACADESDPSQSSPPTESPPTAIVQTDDGSEVEADAPPAAPPPTATLPPTATPIPTATAVPPLGDLRQELDTVEFGADETTLAPIADIVPFYTGNVFRARDGGEGLLNFSNGLMLRLFNNARLSSLQVDNSGTSTEMRMFLWEEGFTADYEPLDPDERLVVDIPGGAEITILGTRFFVVYDPLKERTTVANFDGAVQIDVNGIPTSLQAGFYTRIPDDEQPGPQHPIPEASDPFGAFELRARELVSAIAAADEYPELEFEDIVLAPTPTATVVPPKLYNIELKYTMQQIDNCNCGGILENGYHRIDIARGQLSIGFLNNISGQGSLSIEAADTCFTDSVTLHQYTYTGEFPVTFRGFAGEDALHSLTVNTPTSDFIAANATYLDAEPCPDARAYYTGGFISLRDIPLSTGSQVIDKHSNDKYEFITEVTITPVN